MKKYISKIFLLLLVAATTMVACTKETALPTYSTGNAPVLSSSASSVAPASADSNNVVLTLSWTDPNYATDSTHIKYILEIDSTGRNFSKSVKWTLTKRSQSFTAKQLNAIILGFGFSFNVASGIDARVTSSYTNNNDIKVSNVVKVSATAYKVPPKITPPASDRLFIVGGGTAFGWTNSTTIDPAEEFAKLDETTWVGVFNLNANDQFLVLPVKGAWSEKYATPNNGLPGIQDGGDFKYYTSGGDNFKTPATAGWYKVTLDFQRGRFMIEPYIGKMPTNLWITGDATVGNWSNTPPSNQKATQLNSVTWEITQAFVPNKYYKFLGVLGQWQPQFGSKKNTPANTALSGIFDVAWSSGDPEPDAFATPATAGNYKVQLNYITNNYKVTVQ